MQDNQSLVKYVSIQIYGCEKSSGISSSSVTVEQNDNFVNREYLSQFSVVYIFSELNLFLNPTPSMNLFLT